MMYFGINDGWGVFWMIVTMVAVWGGLIALVVLAMRPSSGGGTERRAVDAGELLRKRLADGSISPEEYRERLQVLDETAR